MKQLAVPSFTVFGEPRHDCAVRAARAPDDRSRQRSGRVLAVVGQHDGSSPLDRTFTTPVDSAQPLNSLRAERETRLGTAVIW